MGKIAKGIGRLAGPVEGLFGQMLNERDGRKSARAALLEAVAGEIFQPAASAEPSVPVMPLRDDVAAVTAKKKSVAAQRGRRGRRSTILTALDDNEGVLGA